MTTKTIDATDLRNSLSEAMKAINNGETLLVKKRGKLKVAMIDLDTYEDLLAASNPDNLKAIKVAREQYKQGQALSFDEVFGDI